MAKSSTPEGIVKAGVMRYLRLQGWFVEINFQNEYTRGRAKGRPDLEATKNGVTIRVETKAPAHRGANGIMYQQGKLSEDQKRYIKSLVDHGAIVIVTASCEEFIRELDELEERLWPEKRTRRLC